MPLPFPHPPLPVPLLQDIDDSVERFEHRAGAFLPVMQARGDVSEYRLEIDRLVRRAYEYGLADQRAAARQGIHEAPKGAA